MSTAMGNRIKELRNYRGMTQKELGLAVGFSEKTADIRIAQYESGTRVPKIELVRKIAEALKVNPIYILNSVSLGTIDIVLMMLEFDFVYESEVSIINYTNKSGRECKAVCFNHFLMDEFLGEWEKVKKMYKDGEITKEEYIEWKINWPDTSDRNCGKEPKHKWRKSDKDESTES